MLQRIQRRDREALDASSRSTRPVRELPLLGDQESLIETVRALELGLLPGKLRPGQFGGLPIEFRASGAGQRRDQRRCQAKSTLRRCRSHRTISV
jgi:hypothetical protein